MLFSVNYYGDSFFGYNFRNPGTFVIPSTMASFSILMTFFSEKYKDKKVFYLSFVSIFLTNSTTGYLIAIIYIFLLLFKKIRVNKKNIRKIEEGSL